MSNAAHFSAIPGSRPSQLVWIGAACMAALLHAGGLFYLRSSLQSVTSDEDLGAPAVVIGIELASPRQEDSNLPLGAKAEDSAAASASVSQKAQPRVTDLPKEIPDEREDPSRIVALKPKEITKDPTEKQVDSRTERSADSVASEASAPSKIARAKTSDTSVALSQGSGNSLEKIKATWQKTLAVHINRFKRYPRSGAGHTTQVLLTFTLDRFGHVLGVSIDKSSGDPAFDEAAIAMMKRADPVPVPPPAIADEGLSFSLPVIFKQRR